MNQTYKLPFPETIEDIRASPSGEYAHENYPESRHAIDFLLPVGTEILAVRGGRVFRVKSDSNRHGLDTALAGEANYVAIDHGDGTYAEYIHLAENGVVVEEGQGVETGDLLGHSGLSGCMSHPHLHFNVFRLKDGKAESLPVEFS